MFTSSLRSHKVKSGNISGKIRQCATTDSFVMVENFLGLYMEGPGQEQFQACDTTSKLSYKA